MANTTNFNWETPDDTDLVKDGALAIRTLGSSIDTTLVDLKGGTTNQVLAKNSDTNMDFKWVADASGIPATIFDAKGDLIAASAADTAARLAVGANDTVLTADSSTATGLKWAAPSPGKLLQVVNFTTTTGGGASTSTFVDTALTATITPTAITSTILVFANIDIQKDNNNGSAGTRLVRGATVIATMTTQAGFTNNADFNNIGTSSITYSDSPNTTSATTYKVQVNAGTGTSIGINAGAARSSITLMEIGA
jgi:hypothetical protein